MMVTKITVFKMKATVMKMVLMITLLSPSPKVCIRVGIEKANVRISIKVASVV